jgi:hypothetical protein
MLGALNLLFALGRDDLRVVRYCSSESDRIISSWGLLDVHVVSKVPVVDTEVDSAHSA